MFSALSKTNVVRAITTALLLAAAPMAYSQILPFISINDVTGQEGQSGLTDFVFTVSLNIPASTAGVSFDIFSFDNTAVAGDDYVGFSLTNQSFAEGQSALNYTVSVFGDSVIESNESFFVGITNLVNAIPVDSLGQGMIINDDSIHQNPKPVPLPGAGMLFMLGLVGLRGVLHRILGA